MTKLERMKLPKYKMEKRETGFYGIKLDDKYIFDHFFSESFAKEVVKALKREYRRGFRDSETLRELEHESDL